jgi:hypothetical protein
LSRTAIKYRLVSREALEQYAGKWTAVRDREVIAAAESHEALRSNPEVRLDDGTLLAQRSFIYAIRRLLVHRRLARTGAHRQCPQEAGASLTPGAESRSPAPARR